MTIIVVLFWLWVAVSCVLFVRRRVAGARRRRGGHRTEGRSAHPGEGGAPRSEPTQPDSAPGTAPVHPVEPMSSPSAVSVRSEAGTLAEALQGMAMPCDLVPLTQRVADAFDPGHMTLTTDTEPAETVVSELASELERLGCSVQVHEQRVRAERGTVAVTATVTERLDDQLAPSVLVEFTLG